MGPPPTLNPQPHLIPLISQEVPRAPHLPTYLPPLTPPPSPDLPRHASSNSRRKRGDFVHPTATPVVLLLGPTAEQRPTVRIATLQGFVAFLFVPEYISPPSRVKGSAGSFAAIFADSAYTPSYGRDRLRNIRSIRHYHEPVTPMMIHQTLRRLRYLPHIAAGRRFSRTHVYRDCRYGSVARKR